MVQIDLPWALLIGSTLAESDKVQIPSDTAVFRNQCFLGGMAFMCLLFNPSAMYLLWRYPDWETLYWVKGSIPFWLPPLDLALLTFLYVLRFWWGYTRIQKGHLKTLQIFNRTLTFLIPLFVVLHHRQFFFVGTYQEFVAGQNINLLHTTLSRDLVIMALLLTPSYLYVYRYFWFEGKKSTGTAISPLSPADNRRMLLTAIAIGVGAAAAAAGFVAVVWHFQAV
jgi:hypothetical protein